MLMVRVNLTTVSPYFFIRIKLVREMTFFVDAVNRPTSSITVFIVTSLTVTLLINLDKVIIRALKYR